MDPCHSNPDKQSSLILLIQQKHIVHKYNLFDYCANVIPKNGGELGIRTLEPLSQDCPISSRVPFIHSANSP